MEQYKWTWKLVSTQKSNHRIIQSLWKYLQKWSSVLYMPSNGLKDSRNGHEDHKHDPKNEQLSNNWNLESSCKNSWIGGQDTMALTTALLLSIQDVWSNIIYNEKQPNTIFLIFLSTLRQMLKQYFKMDHDHFLTSHSDCTIFHWKYELCSWISIAKFR